MIRVILRPFGDGVYAFSLTVGPMLEELQEKTDAGPFELYRRLMAGAWRMVDVSETIRLGLVCGGKGWPGATLDKNGELEGAGDPIVVDESSAIRLVRSYVKTYGVPAFDPESPDASLGGPRPWAESALLAAQILEAGLMGKADEPLGKKTPGEEPDPNLSPGAKSDGPQSSPDTPTGA